MMVVADRGCLPVVRPQPSDSADLRAHGVRRPHRPRRSDRADVRPRSKDEIGGPRVAAQHDGRQPEGDHGPDPRGGRQPEFGRRRDARLDQAAGGERRAAVRRHSGDDRDPRRDQPVRPADDHPGAQRSPARPKRPPTRSKDGLKSMDDMAQVMDAIEEQTESVAVAHRRAQREDAGHRRHHRHGQRHRRALAASGAQRRHRGGCRRRGRPQLLRRRRGDQDAGRPGQGGDNAASRRSSAKSRKASTRR